MDQEFRIKLGEIGLAVFMLAFSVSLPAYQKLLAGVGVAIFVPPEGLGLAPADALRYAGPGEGAHHPRPFFTAAHPLSRSGRTSTLSRSGRTSTDGSPHAEMDTDVRGGYGRETVKVLTAGLRSLRIAVHNHSSESILTTSDAKVVVSFGERRRSELSIHRRGDNERWWTVAEYDHPTGQLQMIDMLSQMELGVPPSPLESPSIRFHDPVRST